MPDSANPFRVLDLSPSASPEEIRSRYRELARRHHPDAGSEPDARRMAEVNAAYELLARDLEGCRRRYAPVAAGPDRRSTDRTRYRTSPSRDYRSNGPEAKSPATFWQDWLKRAGKAATRRSGGGGTATQTRPAALSVSPAVLTLCRAHGEQLIKVRGSGDALVRVRFPTAHLDVRRQPAEGDIQRFKVRLAGRALSSPDESLYLELRTAGGGLKKVPIYEFSCPSAEGACVFAS